MKEKSHISPRTKKILVGVGVGFGTIMAFLVSFILAFSLIVNPINFMTVSDADTMEENEKLKEQVQTLEDEVEMLNTTVAKYKNSASSAPVVQSPVVTTPSNSQTSTSQSAQPSRGTAAGADDAATQVAQTTKGEGGEPSDGEGQGFAPETSTSTGAETPEDVESPITVIDISE